MKCEKAHTSPLAWSSRVEKPGNGSNSPRKTPGSLRWLASWAALLGLLAFESTGQDTVMETEERTFVLSVLGAQPAAEILIRSAVSGDSAAPDLQDGRLYFSLAVGNKDTLRIDSAEGEVKPRELKLENLLMGPAGRRVSLGSVLFIQPSTAPAATQNASAGEEKQGQISEIPKAQATLGVSQRTAEKKTLPATEAPQKGVAASQQEHLTNICEDPLSLRCAEASIETFSQTLESGQPRKILKALESLDRELLVLWSQPRNRWNVAVRLMQLAIQQEANVSLHDRLMEAAIRVLEKDLDAWCDPEHARLLASAYGVLGNFPKAASSAGASSCKRKSSASEWQIYFLHQAGKTDDAQHALRNLDGEVKELLRAWLAPENANCSGFKDLLATDPMPCQGLTQVICRTLQADVLLQCGFSMEAAADVLRQALSEDLQDFQSPPEGIERQLSHKQRQLLEGVTELYFASQNFDQAFKGFQLLNSLPSAVGPKKFQYSCRLGSTLLLLGRQAEAAPYFRQAMQDPNLDEADWLVAANNLWALESRIGSPIPADALAGWSGRLGRISHELMPQRWLVSLQKNRDAFDISMLMTSGKPTMRRYQTLVQEVRDSKRLWLNAEGLEESESTSAGQPALACSVLLLVDEMETTP